MSCGPRKFPRRIRPLRGRGNLIRGRLIGSRPVSQLLPANSQECRVGLMQPSPDT